MGEIKPKWFAPIHHGQCFGSSEEGESKSVDGRAERVRKGLTEETYTRGGKLYGQKALSGLQGLL